MTQIYYLKNAEISFGGAPLFSNLNLQIASGDKICLIGRNGCGKSTLLKIIKDLIELDKGEKYCLPGLKIGYLAQNVTFTHEQNIYDFVLEDVSREEDLYYYADQILQPLGLRGTKLMAQLSGGKLRRAALAKALISNPDLLLLDEPTNHLDISSIEWLQSFVNKSNKAVICISHDRAFLEAVTAKTFWLDRGKLRINQKGYSDFNRWTEEFFAQEERDVNRLQQKLDIENIWRQQGVTARRKRNQRRLQELYTLRARMRQEKANQQTQMASVKLPETSASKAAKMVVEIEALAHKFYDVEPPKNIINKLSLRVIRGEKIGIMGNNGSGKSSFLKLLMGEIAVQEGSIKFANKLQISYFDQNRQVLDQTKTLREILCPNGNDQLKIGDEYKHISAYLKDFLFSPNQIDSPVSSLSGGEANRLLLAKILSKPADLLILDEPSNDLDMDSLDILTELLADYNGTLLLVSHDRDLLDQIVTRTWFFEGNGQVVDFVGGYEDYNAASLNSKSSLPGKIEVKNKKTTPAKTDERHNNSEKVNKLSYNDKRMLQLLPQEIALLEQEINTIEAAIADSNLFLAAPTKFNQLIDQLANKKTLLTEKENQWMELEILQEEFDKKS